MRQIDYSDVLKELTAKGLKFTVVGGFAAVAHGVVRVTMDLDLAIALEHPELSKAWDLMQDMGFAPRQPLTKIDFSDPNRLMALAQEKGMKAVSFVHKLSPFLIVDFLFDADFQLQDADREFLNLFDCQCPVATVDTLIRLKRIASRPKDLEDVRALEHIKKNR